MPTFVGTLTFMSRINFELSCVEREEFYNLRAGTRPDMTEKVLTGLFV